MDLEFVIFYIFFFALHTYTKNQSLHVVTFMLIRTVVFDYRTHPSDYTTYSPMCE